jgi:hypothetical protein
MAGILGTQAAATPKKGGGLFGWFNDDPGAITGPTDTGRAPLTGAQKQGLLFSGIADAIDSLQGRQGNTTEGLSQQYQQDYTTQKAAQRRAAANKAISDAYASGDMNAVRSAILNADPQDIAHIHDALGMTQPKIHDIHGGAYSESPLDGSLTQVIAPLPKAPIISNGMMSNDNGATFAPIPGYVAQQQAIAGARRAPPKPSAAVAGPLGNPAALFGGR